MAVIERSEAVELEIGGPEWLWTAKSGEIEVEGMQKMVRPNKVDDDFCHTCLKLWLMFIICSLLYQRGKKYF